MRQFRFSLPALCGAVLAACLLSGCAAASPAPESAASSAVSSSAESTGSTPSPALPGGVSPAAEKTYPKADCTVDEDLYINWVNELTWNCDLYLEKTVRIQGMYTSEKPDGLDTVFSYVYRIGPGCCGTDGDLCGMQLVLPDGIQPADGDWIDVYGTLRIKDLAGYKFLVLDETSVTVDNEHRGMESVLHQL
jgi:uncharacterized membrane protein YcgQ (UPF0703/DUF1980 family)